MQELHEDILKQAVADPVHHSKHVHVHQRHAAEGGAVVVDTIEGALKESGEVIKAKIGGQGVVELGELVMLKRNHWAEKAEKERLERERQMVDGKLNNGGGHGLGHLFHKKDSDKKYKDEGDGGLREWLVRGNVIYKSVGIGLMDVVVGMEIVKLADARGIGTTISNF